MNRNLRDLVVQALKEKERKPNTAKPTTHFEKHDMLQVLATG